jgi:zinc protease
MKNVSKLLTVVTLLIVSMATSAQNKPKFITAVEGLKEYELDNGLRILLIPDASQTNIAINIVYKVGSRHEGYGEKGMAHLLEHMLFKQCEKFEDIKKAIADKGAFANGTTWYDRTNYYEVLSASDENLRWAIDMEADRMVNSKILATELAKEFSVVRNEFEINENNPGGVLFERVLSSMYLWHNYGSSTIGSKEDIERVKAESLKAFYKKYYQPDNAIIMIAGKFDEAKALEYAEQYFGPIPRPARVLQATYTVEPPQDGQRDVLLQRNGDVQYLVAGYHTPPAADNDFAANEAFLSIITNNPSGKLYKALVEKKLATSVSNFVLPLHDPGFSIIQAEIPKDKNLDSVKTAFFDVMNNIKNISITEEDVTNAKNNLLKRFSNTTNNSIELAIMLTEIVGAGDWRLWFHYRDQLEKLTAEHVKAVAAKYYKPTNRTIGYFVPSGIPDRTIVNETPDIAALLKDYKGKEVAEQKAAFETTIPNIKKNTEYGKLTNGGKYALLFKPTKGDKINGTIVLQYGDENSLANKGLTAALTARMLKNGTTTKTKKQIKDELDRIKTDINFYASAGKLNVSISTDKANLPKALALLDDLLHNPKFDKDEFEKEKLALQTQYETNAQEPGQLAYEKLMQLSTKYPKGHPLYTNTTQEALAELAAIKPEDTKNFYNNFYGAANSNSTFVGEIDKPVITAALKKTLGNWKSKAAFKEIKRQYFDVNGTTASVPVSDKTNAQLLGGINLNITEKSNDYPAVYMANELLGGGAFLSSRIPQRLRENEGMSYGAGSYLDVDYDQAGGLWGLYAAYNPEYKDRLDSALNQEIDKAISAGFTQEELSKSIESWLEQQRTSLGMNNVLAAIINQYQRQGRSLDEYTQMENKIKALELKTVNEALKKYFDKKKLILINSGDFKKKGF